MKNIFPLLIVLLLTACNRQNTHDFSLTNQPDAKRAALATYNDSVSYALGVNIGRTLKDNGMDSANTALIAQGVNDYLKKNALVLCSQQSVELVNGHLKMLADKQGAANQTEEQNFLAENKKQPNVVTLPSGLQYLILKTGTGDAPTATDIVTVHYHGTFVDGTVFDSSVERGKPVQMPVNRTISAFTEALQLMPVGSKWKLFVPANLAYGSTGYKASVPVPAGKAFVFELELISIVD